MIRQGPAAGQGIARRPPGPAGRREAIIVPVEPGTLLRVLSWLVFGQGILLGAVCFGRARHKSNVYLGILLALLSIHALIGLSGPARQGDVELRVMLGFLPFLYGPLVYRYVWHSLFRDWPDPVPFALHALPAAMNVLVYGGYHLIAGRAGFLEAVDAVFAGRPPWFVTVVEWAKVVQGASYTVWIVVLLRRHREALRRWAAREQRRRWLRWMLAVFALNWALVLVSGLLVWGRSDADPLRALVNALQLAALLAFLYTVTFFVLRYPAVMDPKEVREEIRRKLNLPEGFVEETLRRLDAARDAGAFADPEVTLSSLAEKIGLHPNALSYIVNETYGTGFREYLNGWRLEEFLRTAREAGADRPLLDSAYAAGFASKTTFLRAFRKRYGATPSEYLTGDPG